MNLQKLGILGRKFTAVFFIGLILLGNYWLVHFFSNTEPPVWTGQVFGVLIAGAVCSGLLMLVSELLSSRGDG